MNPQAASRVSPRTRASRHRRARRPGGDRGAGGAVEAYRRLRARGVRGVVVISAGFAETRRKGPRSRAPAARAGAGRRDAHRGTELPGRREHGPGLRLNATFAPSAARGQRRHRVAERRARRRHPRACGSHGIGVSTFVSLGNKADVSGNDLLAYWADDPRTAVSRSTSRASVIRVLRVARAGGGAGKPIVAVKSGRSAAGGARPRALGVARQPSTSAVDALFEQAGVIRTNTLEEYVRRGGAPRHQPLPAGAACGCGDERGRPGHLFADACEARGLALPSSRRHAARGCARFLPPPRA